MMFSFTFSNPIASLLRFGYILFIKLSYELLENGGDPQSEDTQCPHEESLVLVLFKLPGLEELSQG